VVDIGFKDGGKSQTAEDENAEDDHHSKFEPAGPVLPPLANSLK
jgi:hypothetical protein